MSGRPVTERAGVIAFKYCNAIHQEWQIGEPSFMAGLFPVGIDERATIKARNTFLMLLTEFIAGTPDVKGETAWRFAHEMAVQPAIGEFRHLPLPVRVAWMCFADTARVLVHALEDEAAKSAPIQPPVMFKGRRTFDRRASSTVSRRVNLGSGLIPTRATEAPEPVTPPPLPERKKTASKNKKQTA